MIAAHRTHEHPIDVPAAVQPQKHLAAEEAVVPFGAVGVKAEDAAGKAPQESDPQGSGDKAAPGFIKVFSNRIANVQHPTFMDIRQISNIISLGRLSS